VISVPAPLPKKLARLGLMAVTFIVQSPAVANNSKIPLSTVLITVRCACGGGGLSLLLIVQMAL
jgi:hypothetical protein